MNKVWSCESHMRYERDILNCVLLKILDTITCNRFSSDFEFWFFVIAVQCFSFSDGRAASVSSIQHWIKYTNSSQITVAMAFECIISTLLLKHLECASTLNGESFPHVNVFSLYIWKPQNDLMARQSSVEKYLFTWIKSI